MSKASDNEIFARIVQTHLQVTGHYQGAIDGWAGRLTQSAYRQYAGIEPDTTPVQEPVATGPEAADLPAPAPSYRLPAEGNAALNSYYGAANANGNYLDWFSFPHPATRLYNRSGQLLTDKVGDDRLDHRCHRALVGRLTAALAEIYVRLGRAEFERQGWHVYGGCFNYRAKRGGSSLSTHAWGIAIDINPDENPYNVNKTTFSALAIDIMERWGFLSGGRAWGHDWMHFQAAIPNISSGSYYAKNGLPKNIVRA